MTISRRGTVRWLARGTAALFLVLVGAYSPLLFPRPFFPHELRSGELTLRCDAEISDGLEASLREADERIAAMELHRPGGSPRIHLCTSPRLYRYLSFLTRGRPDIQGFVITATGNAFLNGPFIEGMRRRTGGLPRQTRLEATLATAISHEAAHQQVRHAMGYRASASLPHWKGEGFADYSTHRLRIREDESYDLAARVARLLDDGGWGPPYTTVDRRHVRWQLITEYLFEVRGLRFAGLIDESLTEDRAWDEMMEWYREAAGG